MKAEDEIYCTIIFACYPKWLGIFGLLTIALFRISIIFKNEIAVYKSTGSSWKKVIKKAVESKMLNLQPSHD
jgi:hypothetical protein